MGVDLATEVPVREALSVTVGARYFPEERTADGAFAFGLSAASLGACVEPPTGTRFALPPPLSAAFCGSVAAGAIHSVVWKLTPLTPGDEPWVGASLAARIRVHLIAPLSLYAAGELVIPLTRDVFAIRSASGGVFQQSPLAPVASLGLSVSIP